MEVSRAPTVWGGSWISRGHLQPQLDPAPPFPSLISCGLIEERVGPSQAGEKPSFCLVGTSGEPCPGPERGRRSLARERGGGVKLRHEKAV